MNRILLFAVAGVLLAASTVWSVVGGGEVVFVTGGGRVQFSHDVHVTMKGKKCTACHYALFTTRARHITNKMKDMEEGRSCGACHNGQDAFDVRSNCTKCHTG